MFTSRTILSAALLRMAALGAVTVGATTIGAASLSAQAKSEGESNTQGMVVGAHVGGMSLSPSGGGKSDNGGGGGVMVGYGFNKNLMVFVGFDVSKLKIDGFVAGLSPNFTFSHVDLGVRYSFANPERAWVPYLDAAITARSASVKASDKDYSFSGTAFTGGGGVQYFFSTKVALDVNFQYAVGSFNKQKIGGVKTDVSNAGNSNSSRLNVGVRYYPNLGSALHTTAH